MSNKYIGQVNNQSFLYPNNYLAEYDIDIIHEINNNSVIGIIQNFTTTLSADKLILNISFDFEWIRNNAEVFRMADGSLAVFSVHIIENNTYFKPNQTVNYYSQTGATPDTIVDNVSIDEHFEYDGYDYSPWPEDTFYYEIRFIGRRAIYPIMGSFTVTYPPPTPTPTPTPSLTPGLTPTPTSTNNPTPTPTPTNGDGGLYRYYVIDKYNCFPCSLNSTGLIGRVSYPTTLTNGYFYNNGDGSVYLVNYEIASTGWTVDLDLSASSGTNCNGTCSI